MPQKSYASQLPERQNSLSTSELSSSSSSTRLPEHPSVWSAATPETSTSVLYDSRELLHGTTEPEQACGEDPTLSSRSEVSSKESTSLSPKEEFLANLYYSHFHPGHPFLLPRNRYRAQIYPPYLRLVVQFVGSRFATSSTGQVQLYAVEAALAPIKERSVALVQSLLLFAIALHAVAERERAVKTLARASDLAIELGLNQADFASTHGTNDPLVEESLRRTWWELYTVDGYLAALHRQRTFRCNSVELGAYLPCDERFFVEQAANQSPTTLRDLDQRFFAIDSPPFSSGAYRIGAIRIIARVIAVMAVGEDTADNVQAVDNAIAAWRYNLPAEKAVCIDTLGTFDQMIFQAQFFVHCASILLHFSRSELLPKIPIVNSVACSERMTQASPTSALHAHKAISASKELSDLAALPPEKPSPLFACGLAFGCIVQLAACSVHSHECLPQHRERVALMTGALKQIGRTWPLSRTILQQLNQTARRTFNHDRVESLRVTPISCNSSIDLNSTLGNVSWLDLFGSGDVNDQAALCGEVWDQQLEDVFGG